MDEGRAGQWVSQAVCRGGEPDAMFVQGAKQNDAKQVCKRCPVQTECLADALDRQTEFGVWGGMTERQRRAVLKQNPGVSSWRVLLERMRAGAGAVPGVAQPVAQPLGGAARTEFPAVQASPTA